MEYFIVEAGEAGERLDQICARRLDLSRSAVQRLIKDALVLVEGKERNPSYKVSAGERIEAWVPTVDLVPEPFPVPTVFEDDYLLVVDKPAGLVVHPGAGNSSGTLVHALLERGIEGGQDPLRPGVVHRLDRDTSGLMVLAKGEPAYTGLVEMLSERNVRRTYRAVVSGAGLPASGTIEAPVGRDPDNPILMTAGVGKPAVTHFEKLVETGGHTMLRVRLETGRTHQIRVHLSAIGHAVYSDPLYGTPVQGRRLWLHAEKLCFVHPVTKKSLEFESRVPDELRKTAEELGLGP
ncbi:MAG: RluA family pseudouridine synthase [Rubrobacteraceae bacterium]